MNIFNHAQREDSTFVDTPPSALLLLIAPVRIIKKNKAGSIRSGKFPISSLGLSYDINLQNYP